jgi:carbamoyltransferase
VAASNRSFSDVEIKAVLDNCRLDYVYEPDWPRLVSRTCRLLTAGKTVAWFQNAAREGDADRSERVVLGDPSARFVRDNINGFLLQRPLDAPLPIALTLEHARELLANPPPPFELRASQARPELTDGFGAAVDDQGNCLVRVVDTSTASSFGDLSAAWEALTGRRVLVAVELALNGSAVQDPRAAVQAFFSSAIDALVIGRFLLMKDYWLMRSGA